MDGEFYFMALGGIGVSLAGFAGLIAALDRRPEHDSPVARWRIRNIVYGGFATTVAGFATVAFYTVTEGDLTLTVRLASLLLLVLQLLPVPTQARPGPAWPDPGSRRMSLALTGVFIGLIALNVVVGSLGYLQLLFIGQVGGPASVFFNTVRDVSRDPVPEDEVDGRRYEA